MTEPTTDAAILLADDQGLIRRGLRLVIDGFDGMRVAAQAADGEAVFRVLESEHIDLLVCDIRMPGIDGLQVVERLRRGANRLPVVLLTTFYEDRLLAEAARLGANAFLLKDAEPAELEEVMRRALTGERVFKPQSTAAYSARLPGSIDDLVVEPLDDREIAVLRLMAAGLSNRDIGSSLHLAEGTIKNRVSTILGKLDVRDRAQAVLKAIRLGLI